MQKLKKIFTIFIPIIILTSLISGCTNIKKNSISEQKTAASAFFHKGVYKSYSPNQKNPNEIEFYIFYDENSGYTQDSERGIGLPFSCVQTNNSVKFRFGGIDEPEEVFKIKSVNNEVIEGSFEDNSTLVFTPAPDANPDNFDAVEYMKQEN